MDVNDIIKKGIEFGITEVIQDVVKLILDNLSCHNSEVINQLTFVLTGLCFWNV